ncbi:RTA1-domain-containing protein [Abortiporus biennis]|nr:RTA1-domain-containing protein [Abortiporus biennis]
MVYIPEILLHAARGQPTYIQHPYNYTPTEWICALFVALYSLSTILHLIQAIYYRLWFLLPTAVLAGIGEIIGWSARLWSSKSPSLIKPFIIQITTTIIAPTPLVAANFVILGQVIVRVGPKYSRLSPLWYTIIFVSADLIALVIQAVGGAEASNAVYDNRNPDPGANIMLAGIVFQMVSITVYITFALEFVMRYWYDRPIHSKKGTTHEAHYLDRNIKQMLFGLGFSSTTIFIRSVYRTIELAGGWDGDVIATQNLFNVCDGAMIVVAFYTLNIFHPGRLLGPGPSWEPEMRSSKKQTQSNDSEKGEGKDTLITSEGASPSLPRVGSTTGTSQRSSAHEHGHWHF